MTINITFHNILLTMLCLSRRAKLKKLAPLTTHLYVKNAGDLAHEEARK